MVASARSVARQDPGVASQVGPDANPLQTLSQGRAGRAQLPPGARRTCSLPELMRQPLPSGTSRPLSRLREPCAALHAERQSGTVLCLKPRVHPSLGTFRNNKKK